MGLWARVSSNVAAVRCTAPPAGAVELSVIVVPPSRYGLDARRGAGPASPPRTRRRGDQGGNRTHIRPGCAGESVRKLQWRETDAERRQCAMAMRGSGRPPAGVDRSHRILPRRDCGIQTGIVGGVYLPPPIPAMRRGPCSPKRNSVFSIIQFNATGGRPTLLRCRPHPWAADGTCTRPGSSHGSGSPRSASRWALAGSLLRRSCR